MLMLGAGEKKAINGIISILWRRNKVVTVMEQRRKRFAIMFCQRLQSVAPCSRMKGPKGEQSVISRFEQIMLPFEKKRSLRRYYHK